MDRISEPTRPKLTPIYEEQTHSRKVGLNQTFMILIILNLELFLSHENEANNQALAFSMRSRNLQSIVATFLGEFCFYHLLLPFFLSLFACLACESIVSLVLLTNC